MGNTVLRGISAALLVTVITLLAGMFWSAMGLGGLSASGFVDIGLVASCLTAGYRTGKESGQWILGGAAALGYVGLSILLVALFLPVSRWGAIQILAEGIIIGIVAGGFGAGKSLGGGYSRGGNFWGEGFSRGGWEDQGEKEIAWEENTTRDFDSERENEWEEWTRPQSINAQEKERKTEWSKEKDIENRNWEDQENEGYFEVRSNETRQFIEKEAKRNGSAAWWEEDASSYKVF